MKFFKKVPVLVWFILISLYGTSGNSISTSIMLNNEKRTLSPAFCNLTGIDKTKILAAGMGIEVVLYNTFTNCNETNIIDLSRNKITELHEDTFMSNINLEELRLNCNEIKSIPPRLMQHIHKLRILDISGNPIKSINGILESNLNDLVNLMIQDIGIYDLDVNEIKMKIPKLELISFGYNPIHINKYKNAMQLFEKKKIQVNNEIENCKIQDNTANLPFKGSYGWFWFDWITLGVSFLIICLMVYALLKYLEPPAQISGATISMEPVTPQTACTDVDSTANEASEQRQSN